MRSSILMMSTIVMTMVFIVALAQVTMAQVDDEVLLCGGFIKRAANLPQRQKITEKIEILLTKDGRIKERADISPNYDYVVPVYERGNYILEIEGPEGWTFASKQIPLNKDGCKDNEEYNFELRGFRVSGKVSSKGCQSNKALEGIKVQLRRRGSHEVIAETLTTSDGQYRFENIAPSSELEVVAQHAHWSFANSPLAINGFDWGNFQIAQDLAIVGFPVSGSIVYDKEPMQNVDFQLKSASGAVKSIVGCTTSDKDSICTVQSGADGRFLFKNVPCGAYSIVPSHKGQTKYDVAPVHQEIKVDAGGLDIVDGFKIVGFSVSGRVLNHDGGLAGVSILVNGKQRTTTDNGGHYTLDKITTGTYKIEAQKEHYIFSSLQHKMTPVTPTLPDIKVTSYHLCGQVSVPTPPAGVIVNPREITLTNSENKQEKKHTDNNGKFCFEVTTGTYKVSISLSTQERAKGLQFASQIITTSITNSPHLDIIFSQSRGSIAGKIRAMKQITSEVPAGLTVTCQPTSRSGDSMQASLSLTKSGDVSFTFRDLLPGSYKISLHYAQWCWSSAEKTIDLLNTEDKNDIEFTQTGYTYEITSPHDQVSLIHEIGESTKNIQLRKGLNELCLAEAGVHKFTVKSCFQFEKDTYTYNTNQASSNKLALKIQKIQLAGSIKVAQSAAVDAIQHIDVKVMSRSSEQPLVVVKAVASEASPAVFTYSYMASLGDELEFVPSVPKSVNLLFYPASRLASVNTESCPPSLELIDARPGLMINGKVNNNIAGVAIKTYNERTGDQFGSEALTDAQGLYTVGPLRDDVEYTHKASKAGYHFKKESNSNNFNAIELGSVVFNFVDSESRQPVQGVLLSLSGEGYRTNLQSAANGSITVSQLFPGTYFIKSLLKEYTITPASHTIELIEGRETKLELVAKRVAFSVFGSVRSLNNEPQNGLIVQAITAAGKVAEESNTDESGNYRVRGLSPAETYRITVVSQASAERSTPAEHSIVIGKADVKNVDFTIISSQSNTFDLTGNVRLSGEVAQQKHLTMLRANLYNKRDNSLYRSIDLGFNSFFDFGALPKSNEYVLKVEQATGQRNQGSSYVFTVEPIQVRVVQPEDKQQQQLSTSYIQRGREQVIDHS
ncbi:hypothetical protein SAMD00019534_094610 [Acytostelium subglobosum LB1]|uniref:hypothetical protein n=1 Tax=Acytostelium subglobosum LB1 TaxID=1410327 RepID=UPI0006449E0F|nr:hypothetical protein SAMD00019534_094610 [Acytostelium subglobosum LB1]GAM26286.1 hypothetical protein SAMD00019534_094610 [Acytostelium subglobosum LB1]|eukprot:XP_012750840.1 hypothetical protein SAMD00019534_094610 [Acytostelium subglobosum LB1]